MSRALPSSITENANGTYTVADVATVLTEAEALALLDEITPAAPTSSPACAMDPTKLTHRWERVA